MNHTQSNREPFVSPEESGEDKKVMPPTPETEIDPGSPANDTEVDLDKTKTKTYPPERHSH